jgi:hypothetical protein
MTPAEIRAAIAASPELQALQSVGNHQGIADSLSIGRTRIEKVAISDLQAYLQTRGLWWAIKAVASNSAHPAQAAAVATIDVAAARYDNIDMTLAVVGQMLGGLVAANVITSADQNAMAALGVVPDPINHEAVTAAIRGA